VILELYVVVTGNQEPSYWHFLNFMQCVSKHLAPLGRTKSIYLYIYIYNMINKWVYRALNAHRVTVKPNKQNRQTIRLPIYIMAITSLTRRSIRQFIYFHELTTYAKASDVFNIDDDDGKLELD
jgi:hypothetical protein